MDTYPPVMMMCFALEMFMPEMMKDAAFWMPRIPPRMTNRRLSHREHHSNGLSLYALGFPVRVLSRQ